jgi:hypothetical protein
MRKRRRIPRMEDEVLRVFVRGDGPEVFAGKEIDLIEEFF